MIGRRMVTAGVVVAAVTAGGVAGAMIGIPGLSGTSSSPTLSATATSGSGATGGEHGPGHFGRHGGAGRDVLDAAAKALKLSTDDLLQKLSDGKTTIADVAKQQKVNVQDVIDAMEAVAKADISNIVNNPFPVRPHFGDQGPLGGSGGDGAVGPGFAGGPMIGGLGIGFGMRGGLGSSIDGVAKALGISSQDLLGDLRNGQSIADIAKSKHVDVPTLIKTLTADAKSKIDASVKAGHLPQSVATKVESNLEQMITQIVDNVAPKGFGGFEFHGGRGGRRGYDGGAPMPNIEMPTAPPGPTN